MKRLLAILLLSSIVCFSSLVAQTVAEEDTSFNPIILIETNFGDIFVELYPKEAPETVKNFLQYVEDGFYDGTIFHRVINGFVVQGGGFEPGMVSRKTRLPIKNEAHNMLKNEAGTLAMARSRAIDSATSQFFINVEDNAFLNHRSKTARGYGYCVFGKVVDKDSMKIVNTIKAVKTTRRGVFADVPEKPVMIKKATLIRRKTALDS